MKKSLITLSFLAWATTMTLAEDQEAVDGSKAEEAPKIACDTPVFNFGEKDQGEDVEHTFILKNEGQGRLKIGNIRTSCGCTVASISSKDLGPGEKAELATRLSLKGRKGRQHKAITVESNDPEQSHFQLTLEGTATTQLQVEPQRIFFGQVEEDKSVTREVQIVSTIPEGLEIRSVESSSSHISTELTTIDEGKEFQLNISTKTPLPRGTLKGNVRVITNSDKYPIINIPITATVLDELMVAPNQIVMVEKEGETVSRYVVVRPGRTKSFEVEKVECPDPSIKVEIKALGKSGYQIRLDNVTATKELNEKKLKIFTNVESMSEIEIPFRIVSRNPKSS